MTTFGVDAYASYTHYADHIRPIWEELENLGNQGTFWQPPHRPQGDRPIIVASSTDLIRVKDRPAIFVEHGAGQTYIDARHPEGYAGGPKRGTVELFVCPSERVAELNRKAYPRTRAVVVGSPRLEWLQRARATPASQPPQALAPSPVPAVSFHWNCRTSPEARWAWPHYQTHGFEGVLGHGHPRSYRQLSRWWESKGVETVERFEDLLARMSVYVCDNSSTIYEAAALRHPVVILNAPWYRREVHHGLRFWDLIPGPQVDHPSELADAIAEAPSWSDKRDRIAQLVYSPSDGAARRAAESIAEQFNPCLSPRSATSHHPPAERVE